MDVFGRNPLKLRTWFGSFVTLIALAITGYFAYTQVTNLINRVNTVD
jgi:hypothetical protein